MGNDASEKRPNKDTPIGLCDLLKRDYFDSIDTGYVFANAYRLTDIR
jgi:hypothetical protein